MSLYNWVVVILRNNCESEIVKVKNVRLLWGKFHADNDKDREIPKSDIEGKVIAGKGSFHINSCARENAPSGTEGSFELFDGSDTFIRKIYWDCPWGPRRNTFTISGQNEDWVVEDKGANRDHGAIGVVTVTMVNVPDD